MVLPITYRFRNVKGGIFLDEHEDTIHGWDRDPQKDSQKWVLEAAEDGWHIKNLQSGLYVSTSNRSGDNSVKASSNKDIWMFQNHGRGYVIVLKGSDGAKTIELFEGGDKDGTPVNLVHYTDAGQQLWELQEVEGPQQDLGKRQYKGPILPGTYRVHNILTNTALDLAGGKSDEGMTVYTWSPHAGPNQNWIFEYGSNGYRIKNGTSGTYLRSEKLWPGSTLSCRSASVEWTITQTDKGYLIHGGGKPELVIDLVGGNKADGAKVSVETNGNTDSQKWRIEPVV